MLARKSLGLDAQASNAFCGHHRDNVYVDEIGRRRGNNALTFAWLTCLICSRTPLPLNAYSKNLCDYVGDRSLFQVQGHVASTDSRIAWAKRRRAFLASNRSARRYGPASYGRFLLHVRRYRRIRIIAACFLSAPRTKARMRAVLWDHGSTLCFRWLRLQSASQAIIF